VWPTQNLLCGSHDLIPCVLRGVADVGSAGVGLGDAMGSSMSLGESAMPESPNIMLVMADQMTPFMTGAYGNRQAVTPNIDRLSEEGVRFDAAYTPCPLCAPARASMLTGKYVSEIGTIDNGNEWSAELPTMAHHLRMTGYETVLTGKMHMIGPDQLHGFEKRLTTDIYPADFSWTAVRPDVPRLNPHGLPIATPYVNAGVRPWTFQLAYDEETQFRALEYLRNRAGKGGLRPFFLCVSYSHPHDPFHTTQDLWDLYSHDDIETPDTGESFESFAMDEWLKVFHGLDAVDVMCEETLRDLRHAYLANCSFVDRKLGELVDALRRAGESDNTLIIFTSDHGDMLGERSMVQKRCFYEWSARVPLVFHWPGRWSSARSVAEPVSLLDFLPTINEVIGGPEPVDVDGRSFLDLLDGREPAQEREVFSEYHGEGMLAPCFMLRKGDYKYVYVHGGGEQLFDLACDPDERANLAARPDSRAVAEAMKARVMERFDPDRIEREVRLSQRRRGFVKQAWECGKRPSWDYQPLFDAERMYVRGKAVHT